VVKNSIPITERWKLINGRVQGDYAQGKDSVRGDAPHAGIVKGDAYGRHSIHILAVLLDYPVSEYPGRINHNSSSKP
jgi:hypothetical protein